MQVTQNGIHRKSTHIYYEVVPLHVLRNWKVTTINKGHFLSFFLDVMWMGNDHWDRYASFFFFLPSTHIYNNLFRLEWMWNEASVMIYHFFDIFIGRQICRLQQHSLNACKMFWFNFFRKNILLVQERNSMNFITICYFSLKNVQSFCANLCEILMSLPGKYCGNYYQAMFLILLTEPGFYWYYWHKN